MHKILLALTAAILMFPSCSGRLSQDSVTVQTSSSDQEIAALKAQRQQARIRASLASRDADRFLSLDWLSYQRALERQTYYQHQVERLDAQIAALEKKRK
jgi:hypothetical protein